MPTGIYELLGYRADVPFTAARQFATVLVFAGLLVVLNYFAPVHSNATERLYASLMLLLVAIPLWLWRLGYDRTPPFIVFISLVYFYTYGLCVFLLTKFSGNLYQPDLSAIWVERALQLSLIGMICMLTGYYASSARPLRNILPRFDMRWSDARVVRVAAMIFIFVGLAFAATIIPGLPKALVQAKAYAQDLCTLGICMVIGLWWLGRLRRSLAFGILLLAVPLRLGIGLVGGSSGYSLATGLTFVLMYAAMARRIPWLVVLIGTGALFIIRPLELPYRNATWSPRGELYNASDLEKAEYLGGLAYKVTVGGEVSAHALIQSAGARLAMFPTLADVMSQTPSVVPYWNGASYYPLLFKPIPRLVWPDKPQELTGRTFGQRYGYSTVENSTTSINLPQLVEAYANFGALGVVFGMLIIGALYRLLLELFIHPRMGFGAVVAAVFVVSSLFDIESNTGLVFGSLPWTLVFLFLVDRIILMLHLEADGIGWRAERLPAADGSM